MSADWRTQAQKDEDRWRQRTKSVITPWGSWVRKTQAPIWRRFLNWEENLEILWNMDCNDEVRDHLKGYFKEVYINSNYIKGNEDIFVASFRCPWRMRDLYQYMVVLYRSLRGCDPVERYKQFHLELGYLQDQDGKGFDFGFLLPEDKRFGFYVRPEDIEAWDRMVTEDEGTLPQEEEQHESLSEADLDYLAEAMNEADRVWEEYRTGKRGVFRLQSQVITRGAKAGGGSVKVLQK